MDTAASDAATQILGKAPASTTGLTRDRRDYLVGICILLVVVFLWTASNFVTQVRTVLFQSQGVISRVLPGAQDLFEGGYDKPFWCVLET